MLGLLPRRTVHVVLLVVAIFLGFQYIPIYFNALRFNDEAYEVVRFAGQTEKSVSDVHSEIMQIADKWVVPVEEEDVKVEVVTNRDGPIFYVEIYYAVPVNLRVFRHEIEFDWEMSGESFDE